MLMSEDIITFTSETLHNDLSSDMKSSDNIISGIIAINDDG